MMSTVSEKLLQVAQNNPKVYHSGKLNIVKNAECLKGTKSDTAILLDDISPVTHELGVKVSSKNLFNINAAELINANIIDNGIQFTGSSGGAIDVLLPKGKYTLSFKRSVETKLYLRNGKVDSGYISIISNTETSKTFTFNADVDGYLRIHSFTKDLILSDIQIELGTTATTYTPYVPDLTAVKVSRCGKNLFDINSTELTNATIVDNGIQITGATGGTIDVLLPKGRYTISCKRSIEANLVLRNGKVNNGYITIISNKETSKTFNFNADVDGYLRIATFSSGLILSDIQIELGSTATEYEPYISSTDYTPTADGTVESVESLYPSTTLLTNDPYGKVYIDCEYYKDIDKTFNELTTSVALSGGDS